ncbi:MAG: hypothetical protein ACW99J_18865 [Candidatus Thorarchaeota archaeon]|jgi:hypothetical protein
MRARVDQRGENLVLEGKKPCIVVRRNRLRALNTALYRAGYRQYGHYGFKKINEIGTWTLDFGSDRMVHVQVVASGKFLRIFAHTEQSSSADPFGHAAGAVFELGISYSAGSRKLRADLRKAGFRFK